MAAAAAEKAAGPKLPVEREEHCQSGMDQYLASEQGEQS